MLSADRFLDPVVALLFELERQLAPAGADDAPLEEDVDVVGHDVVEEALVVRDEDDRVLGRAQLVDALRDDAQRVDVEAGVVSSIMASFGSSPLCKISCASSPRPRTPRSPSDS